MMLDSLTVKENQVFNMKANSVSIKITIIEILIAGLRKIIN